jgi:hypothetical protein
MPSIVERYAPTKPLPFTGEYRDDPLRYHLRAGQDGPEIARFTTTDPANSNRTNPQPPPTATPTTATPTTAPTAAPNPPAKAPAPGQTPTTPHRAKIHPVRLRTVSGQSTHHQPRPKVLGGGSGGA